MLRVQVENFLKNFKDLLFLEHLELIYNFLDLMDHNERLGNIAVESKHGTHFISCPWSQEATVEGPDCCECIFFEKRKNFVEDLIMKYNLLSTYFYKTFKTS